ncbi:uncharacterized protein [Lepeophtheirus salmonis]|uniref:uncharacterized protein n=1 Tax=Lepeophtheirus salmonis TaxID=72036 RepID=UPI001AE38057|nr:cuticle protein 8-like [Lepeophtheirus salmonis]
MKVFITISTLLAVVSADQSSHQTIQHGHSAPSHTSLHKPHGSHRHAVHVPVHQSPPYHSSPILHKPAPYHSAPIVHQPAPYHPAPAHKSPYHAESYDTPAVYQYGYAVADDYAGTNFAQNENRDGYSTAGEYRVGLPDGRTQIVNYNVADAYSGYVADVKYEGQAHYDTYKPVHKHAPYHPTPAPYTS